jgi:4-hydroxy-tetrahydrodipicolinate synthase
MGNIGRMLTAMVTPFDREGNVDYKQARQLVQALMDSGSEGVIVCGTTGESPTLSHGEKLHLFGEIKEAIGAKGSVIAGTGSYGTSESIELSREAEHLGVDGLLLVVPYYNKPTQEGLYRHFKAIASSVNIPCILYNVPSRTGTNMTAETTVRLSQIDNITGVKEASGDMVQVGSIIAQTPDDFLVWSGNDSDTFPIMNMGGYGVISVASHLYGLQIQSMMQLLLGGEIEKAAREHHRLMPIFQGLFWVSNPTPVKHALNRGGFFVGTPRLPLVEIDEQTATRLNRVLDEYTIDLPMNVLHRV